MGGTLFPTYIYRWDLAWGTLYHLIELNPTYIYKIVYPMLNPAYIYRWEIVYPHAKSCLYIYMGGRM